MISTTLAPCRRIISIRVSAPTRPLVSKTRVRRVAIETVSSSSIIIIHILITVIITAAAVASRLVEAISRAELLAEQTATCRLSSRRACLAPTTTPHPVARQTAADTSKRHTLLLDMIAYCFHNATILCRRPYPLNGSFVNTSYLPPASYTGTLSLNPAQISQQQQQQVYYLTPNVQRTADQLTEEEQIKLLKRMTLIQQLPSGSYDENKKNKE